MNLRVRIPDWLLLLAFCAFFFLWRLSSIGLIGADEPRYAQIAREMLARHDWVTPVLGGNPWLEKPPLYYWQAMMAYRLFGVGDWAARLPSVLDANLLVFAAYFFLRKFRPGFALDAALMLTASAGITGYARAASTDMPLASTFAVAMLAWFAWFESKRRIFLACFYFFIALAMLAKGPVGAFLAAIIIAVFAATQRSLRVMGNTLWAPGIVLFCAVGLPWYGLVQWRNPQFFRVFILEHNLARFSTNLYHHPEPFWYYLPITLLSWVPWTVFVIAALVWAIRRLKDGDSDTLKAFLLIWIGITVVFFSISESKLPGYILPAVPAGALLCANYVRESWPRSRGFRDAQQLKEPVGQGTRIVASAFHATLSGVLLGAALVSRYTILQRRIQWDSVDIVLLIAGLALGIAVFVLLLKSGFTGVRLAGVLPAILALSVALRWAAPALDETLSARTVSEALSLVSRGHLPVAVALVSRETEFGLQFYRNQKIPRYELGQTPPGEHLVVAKKGFQKELSQDVPARKVVYLGDFPPQRLEFFYVSE